MHYITNLGSKDDEFFCYGITDSINIELNKINNISAPASANILKIKDLDSPTKIGESLNVDYVVQGSLMNMADLFRLSITMTNIINFPYSIL